MPDQGDPASFEYELKLLLPERRIPCSLVLLRALCREDPRHPSNVVVSIYYDTRGFHLLHDKIDSQRLKTKVRLRWYEQPDGAKAASPAFAELKYRIGSRRRKIRARAPLGSERFAHLPLHHPALPEISSLLPDEVFAARGRLLPLLTLRYHRRRFVDPLTGTRISLDTDLSVQRINRRLLPYGSPGHLAACVVEVKRDVDEVPPRLRPLLRMGARPASFSKYAAGFAQALEAAPRMH